MTVSQNFENRLHRSVLITYGKRPVAFFLRDDVIGVTRSRRRRRRPLRLVACSARTRRLRENRLHQNDCFGHDCVTMREKGVYSINRRTSSKRRKNQVNPLAAEYLVKYSPLRPSVGAPPTNVHIFTRHGEREAPNRVSGPLRTIRAACTCAAARRDAREPRRCETRPRVQRVVARPRIDCSANERSEMTTARGGAVRAADARSGRGQRARAASDERARGRAIENVAPGRATSEGVRLTRHRAAARAHVGGQRARALRGSDDKFVCCEVTAQKKVSQLSSGHRLR